MIMFENVFIAEKLLYNSYNLIRALLLPNCSKRGSEKKKLQNVSTCVNKSGDVILF